jgi:hypothetical protein
MKISDQHKHIWYRGRVFSVDWYNNRWNCNRVGWGRTALRAVIEATQSNTYDHSRQPKTVSELHADDEY